MKSFIALCIAALLLLLALAGCRAGAGVPEPQGNAPPPDISGIVEHNLDIIMSSPATSSSPGDYISSHEAQYNEIVALGVEALQYMFSIFDEGGQIGLRGWIMALACSDILGEDVIFAGLPAETGQDWYDAYILASAE